MHSQFNVKLLHLLVYINTTLSYVCNGYFLQHQCVNPAFLGSTLSFHLPCFNQAWNTGNKSKLRLHLPQHGNKSACLLSLALFLWLPQTSFFFLCCYQGDMIKNRKEIFVVNSAAHRQSFHWSGLPFNVTCICSLEKEKSKQSHHRFWWDIAYSTVRVENGKPKHFL